MKFGIYIYRNENNFMENIYDNGISIWCCKIQGIGENILIFYVNFVVMGNMEPK